MNSKITHGYTLNGDPNCYKPYLPQPDDHPDVIFKKIRENIVGKTTPTRLFDAIQKQLQDSPVDAELWNQAWLILWDNYFKGLKSKTLKQEMNDKHFENYRDTLLYFVRLHYKNEVNTIDITAHIIYLYLKEKQKRQQQQQTSKISANEHQKEKEHNEEYNDKYTNSDYNVLKTILKDLTV